jgi:hypothetical protein
MQPIAGAAARPCGCAVATADLRPLARRPLHNQISRNLMAASACHATGLFPSGSE